MGKYFSVKSSPVLDEDGEVIAAVEVFRDVTRERKLELELIEKNTKMSNDYYLLKDFKIEYYLKLAYMTI